MLAFHAFLRLYLLHNSNLIIAITEKLPPASSISTCLTSAVTDLLSLENSTFQHLQQHFHFFCCPLHSYDL